MPLSPGDLLPDLTATDHTGAPVRLADLHADGPLVLFSYPKASTPGCTAQACHFRDLAGEFAELGATVVGVSRDGAGAQARFAAAHDFAFPLLVDRDGAVSQALGAKRPGPLWSKRQTTVVGADGRVIEVVRSELDMQVHADRALAVLREAAAANR